MLNYIAILRHDRMQIVAPFEFRENNLHSGPKVGSKSFGQVVQPQAFVMFETYHISDETQ